MKVLIQPGFLKGSVAIPPSKSQSHRAIIAASLSKGKSVISNIVYSRDIEATINAMEKIGAKIIRNPNQLIITGITRIFLSDDNFIDCNESGSTLRFAIPILSLSRQKVVFTGKKSLFQRPLGVYESLFCDMNLQFQKNDDSLIISGSLSPGVFTLPGNISSQFISGLLFALPLLKDNSKIIVTDPFESRQYVDMTLQTLKQSGIEVKSIGNEYFIKGNQTYQPINVRIEGDFSQMSSFAIMGLLGSDIECRNMPEISCQPDYRILDFIKKAKGKYSRIESGYRFQASETVATNFDVSQSPDIAPVLAIMAALSPGTSKIENAGRLKFKESNRLQSIYNMLKTFGVKVEIDDDSLTITGQTELDGGVFDSYNDHRIVMAIAIASSRATRQVIIKNAEAVNKSYPDFFADMRSLGANFDIIDEE